MKPLGILAAVLGVVSVGWIGCYVWAQNNQGPLISAVVEITEASSSAVLSATTEATPSATITVKPTPTPTKVKPTPTPAPTPTASLSQEVSGFVDRFSAQYGVDPNVLRHVAICESGFRSNAKNGPYIGLFQFGATTWINIRKEMHEEASPDLRYSAEESMQTAAYVLSKGKGGIWPNCMP
jgi:soluble lytic murein transglycosylase-like protein